MAVVIPTLNSTYQDRSSSKVTFITLKINRNVYLELRWESSDSPGRSKYLAGLQSTVN